MSSHTMKVNLNSSELKIISYMDTDKQTIYGVHPNALDKLGATFQIALEQFVNRFNSIAEDFEIEPIQAREIGRQEIEEQLQEQSEELYPLTELEGEIVANDNNDTVEVNLIISLELNLPDNVRVQDIKGRILNLPVSISWFEIE